MIRVLYGLVLACFLTLRAKCEEHKPTMKIMINETLLNDVLLQYLPTNFDKDLQIRNMSLGPLKFLWMSNSIPL